MKMRGVMFLDDEDALILSYVDLFISGLRGLLEIPFRLVLLQWQKDTREMRAAGLIYSFPGMFGIDEYL